MFDSKQDDYVEEILLDMYPSRRRFIGEYILFFILLSGSLLILFDVFAFPFEVSFIQADVLITSLLFSFGLIPLLYAEIRRHVEDYVISKNGVYEDVGYFDKRSTNLPFVKIERCEIEESLYDRILSIGNVRVDAGQDFFVIKGVAHPEKVRNIIRNQMSEAMTGGRPAALND
ncbi:MAG: PH domain-containing protein [Candidatus Aenigmatarchaeota archaeon]